MGLVLTDVDSVVWVDLIENVLKEVDLVVVEEVADPVGEGGALMRACEEGGMETEESTSRLRFLEVDGSSKDKIKAVCPFLMMSLDTLGHSDLTCISMG